MAKGNSSIDNKKTSISPTHAKTVSIGNNGNGDHKNGALNGYDATGAKGLGGGAKKIRNLNSSP